MTIDKSKLTCIKVFFDIIFPLQAQTFMLVIIENKGQNQ